MKRFEGRYRQFAPVVFLAFVLSSACSSDSSVRQESDGGIVTLLEINKYQVGVDVGSHPYGAKVLSDGKVLYTGMFGVRVIERNTYLSREELSDALRLLEEYRRSPVENERKPSEAPETTLATMRLFRKDAPLVLRVSADSSSQVQRFRDIETRLKIESMRCPFPVVAGGREVDACALEQDNATRIKQGVQK